MDDEALDSTAAVSDITVEGSVSKISDRNRLLAIAGEEELFAADRSAWADRWQHPLVKSIQTRRGRTSRL